jgi:hypothetical protein
MENALRGQVNELAALTEQLSDRDRRFAWSLITQYRERGSLSDKQRPYVAQLIERATKPKPQLPTAQLGNGFDRIITLFLTARVRIKYPRIRLALPNGQPVVLKMAGERSKYNGQINVSDGGPYGDNIWYGRIDQQGRWSKSRNVTPEVEELLTSLTRNPEEVAEMYGRLTNHCCFCGRELTDPRSVEVGYGPVCAQNYGLSWGEDGIDASRDRLKEEFKEKTGQNLKLGRVPGTHNRRDPELDDFFSDLHQALDAKYNEEDINGDFGIEED